VVGAGKVSDYIVVGAGSSGSVVNRRLLDMRAAVWSQHLLAVQLAEWIGDKLKARAVGVTEVQRVFAAFV
jgi:hypothetical protein